ncbi:MAG: hypothetical protein HY846_10425 [Nitrosomonadales bacterium]|nr:hypothetical protein [Nitrosomonadales bacterium]
MLAQIEKKAPYNAPDAKKLQHLLTGSIMKATVQTEYGVIDCNPRDTGHSIESLPLAAIAVNRTAQCLSDAPFLARCCYTHTLTACLKPVIRNQHLVLIFESLDAVADDMQLEKHISYRG